MSGSCNKNKIFYLFIGALVVFIIKTNAKYLNEDFDYFIFSQRWLPTSCLDYLQKNPSPGKNCQLPKNNQIWAIHGLWPQGHGSHIGPFYCNRSLHFDMDALSPIYDLLLSNWPNIQIGSVSSLWKHEWDKHGTCAVVVESLNSEFKYFNSTLNLYSVYNMHAILNQLNIVSHNSLEVTDLLGKLKNKLKKNCYVHCIKNVHSGQFYLSEIRLCFDKMFNLVNCDEGNKNHNFMDKPLTNCPFDSYIIYPDRIDYPTTDVKLLEAHKNKIQRYHIYIEILKIIKILMWTSM